MLSAGRCIFVTGFTTLKTDCTYVSLRYHMLFSTMHIEVNIALNWDVVTDLDHGPVVSFIEIP